MLCNEYIAHDSKIFILHMRNHNLKNIPVVCVSEVFQKLSFEGSPSYEHFFTYSVKASFKYTKSVYFSLKVL